MSDRGVGRVRPHLDRIAIGPGIRGVASVLAASFGTSSRWLRPAVTGQALIRPRGVLLGGRRETLHHAHGGRARDARDPLRAPALGRGFAAGILEPQRHAGHRAGLVRGVFPDRCDQQDRLQAVDGASVEGVALPQHREQVARKRRHDRHS